MEERFNLVDFGAGSGVKSMMLLEGCEENKQQVMYIPIDISKGSNEHLAKDLKEKHPQANATILTGTYDTCLAFLNQNFNEQNLLCMFGTSIGN